MLVWIVIIQGATIVFAVLSHLKMSERVTIAEGDTVRAINAARAAIDVARTAMSAVGISTAESSSSSASARATEASISASGAFLNYPDQTSSTHAGD